MTVLIIIAALCAIMGIVVLMGKGDKLIAGYNTASEKEKEKYNIHRLRFVVGVVLLAVAFLMPLLLLKVGNVFKGLFSGIVVILSIAAVILANTWAKKK
ncbi:MAG: DUF3784 domain-containing protein [Bacteroidales bacterium]|nr:DUF3784 domain-containing protein [Bacteroidales bacterium]